MSLCHPSSSGVSSSSCVWLTGAWRNYKGQSYSCWDIIMYHPNNYPTVQLLLIFHLWLFLVELGTFFVTEYNLYTRWGTTCGWKSLYHQHYIMDTNHSIMLIWWTTELFRQLYIFRIIWMSGNPVPWTMKIVYSMRHILRGPAGERTIYEFCFSYPPPSVYYLVTLIAQAW